MLKEEFRHLKSLLQALIARFEGLAELFQEERSLIKAREAAAVEAMAARIEQELAAIKALEGERLGVTANLARELQLATESPSLKELDQALGGRGGLLPVRERLQGAIARAEQLNRENQAILQGVQGATEAMLEMLRDGARPVGYNRRGTRSQGQGFNLFSRKL